MPVLYYITQQGGFIYREIKTLIFYTFMRRDNDGTMVKANIVRFGVLVCFMLVGMYASSQKYNARANAWKRDRHSIGFGLGAANFLGELGGKDEIGSDFLNDFEWSQTRPAIQVNYKYRLGKFAYARSQLSFAYVAGSDATTEEIFRRNRNLHFRSTVTELAAMLEVSILDKSRSNMYDRNISQGTLAGWSIYGLLGIGVTHFNAKANFNGDWYALRQFGTEGQLQEGGPKKYGLFTAVIPMGLGIRYELNREWTLGLEVAHRITFTDYMDDVSTVYFDNDVISSNQGELAAFFADPSLGYRIDENGQQIPMNSTFPGAQRGDPADNDSYMFAHLTAQYKINKRRYKGRFSRTTKRRAKRVLF